MIVILLAVIYMLISSFLWGTLCRNMLSSALNRILNPSLDEIVLTGACMLTVFAEFFSLVHGVGFIASVIVLTTNIVLIVWMIYSRQIQGSFRIAEHKWQLVLSVILMILLCAAASNESAHFDTELYHAQSIRWIEEYGLVPGAANLLSNLGYNSAVFPLQALFSFKWLLGQSLRTTNVFFAIIMDFYALWSFRSFSKGKFHVSDVFRIGLFLVNINPGEIPSSSTDRIAAYFIMYVFCKMLSSIEDNCQTDESAHHQACVAMISVYALTLKLSAAPILLFALFPIFSFIKKKQWRPIMVYTCYALLIGAPYIIRNVILTGWLIYPFAGIDLFSVDWKIPKRMVIGDAEQIKYWGYNLQNETPEYRNSTNLLQWIIYWFHSLSLKNKFLILCDAIAFITGPCLHFRKRQSPHMCFYIIVDVCLLFWLINSPNMRYGRAYLFFGLLYLTGILIQLTEWIYQHLLAENMIFQWCYQQRFHAIQLLLVMLMLLSVPKALQGIRNYPLIQADYHHADGASFIIDGVPIYYPLEPEQEGYYLFPSAVRTLDATSKLHLRKYGDISYGFYLDTQE